MSQKILLFIISTKLIKFWGNYLTRNMQDLLRKNNETTEVHKKEYIACSKI